MNYKFKAIVLLLICCLSACVSVQKITYVEPAGTNKIDWKMNKEPDPLYWGFYDLSFTKSISDTVGKGTITLDFDFRQQQRFVFDLVIKEKDNVLLKQIDLDNLESSRIRDSLIGKKIGTGENLSYHKMMLSVAGRSEPIKVDLKEYFLGWPHLREIRGTVNYKLKKGQHIKIITGDTYLDGIFNQYDFIVRSKTKIGILTHMN